MLVMKNDIVFTKSCLGKQDRHHSECQHCTDYFTCLTATLKKQSLIFVMSASLAELPKYLTDNNAEVREAAKARYEKLERG